MMDILFIIAMLAPMVVAFIFKIYPLAWVLTIFNVIFGIVEVISKKVTGSTVSQYFWKFSKGNKVKAIVMLATMALMWIALLLHLSSKL